MLWPALLNGYPIVFSDTGGLLAMGLDLSMGWDKPWVYGPALVLVHLRLTLWGAAAAQGILVSYALWLTQSVLALPRPIRHLMLCALLAVATTASWVTATIMPDLLTPIAVLMLFVLGESGLRLARVQLAAAGLIATFAIAAHLSNLIVSAACIITIAGLRRAIPWRPALPLGGALAILLATNWIGHGRPAISPYGSVFALARLVGDGPARDYLDRVCPQAGFRLCAWRGKLTGDSDQFLWDPAGPFWSDPSPVGEFAAEASQIVTGTVLAEPWPVLRDAARNTARQLERFQLGDTLVSDYLGDAVRPLLQRWFPAAELRRFDAGLQARGLLAAAAQKLLALQGAVIAVSGAACAVILVRHLRRPAPIADFTALLLIAIAANAFATGALSTVHDRYGSRAIWLLVLPPAFLIGLTRRAAPPPPAASAPAPRSRAAASR